MVIVYSIAKRLFSVQKAAGTYFGCSTLGAPHISGSPNIPGRAAVQGSVQSGARKQACSHPRPTFYISPGAFFFYKVATTWGRTRQQAGLDLGAPACLIPLLLLYCCCPEPTQHHAQVTSPWAVGTPFKHQRGELIHIPWNLEDKSDLGRDRAFPHTQAVSHSWAPGL